MIEVAIDMREFFRERLGAALDRREVRVSASTEFYLVELMARYARTPAATTLAKPLVDRLTEALEADDRTQQFRRFRDLGDCALYACGFFSDHLDRRGVARDYVVAMGNRGYDQAGRLAPGSGFDEAYPELAEAFDLLARVLDDVRENTALRTPQDIVRLYERWRRTGSPLLAERLREEGVFPVQEPDEVLH